MNHSPLSQKTVKLGIIGTGSAVRYLHAPALNRVPEIEVIAIADSNPNNLQQVGDRFGIQDRYRHYESLLERSDLDAVAVCVPSALHYDVSQAVIAAGKHLFLEKPITQTLAQADQLIQQAHQSPIKALMGFNLRWHPLIQKARTFIQNGQMGELTLLQAHDCYSGSREFSKKWSQRHWTRDRNQSGGSLLSAAPHHFDLWRFLTQHSVRSITALTHSEAGWDDMRVTINAQLDNGMLISTVFSQNDTTGGAIKVWGEGGSLDVTYRNWNSFIFSPQLPRPFTRKQKLRYFWQMAQQLPINLQRLRPTPPLFQQTFSRQWQHFADVILRDKPIVCTLEDGREALRIAIAASKSLETGKTIHLESCSEDFKSWPDKQGEASNLSMGGIN